MIRRLIRDLFRHKQVFVLQHMLIHLVVVYLVFLPQASRLEELRLSITFAKAAIILASNQDLRRHRLQIQRQMPRVQGVHTAPTTSTIARVAPAPNIVLAAPARATARAARARTTTRTHTAARAAPARTIARAPEDIRIQTSLLNFRRCARLFFNAFTDLFMSRLQEKK